MHFCVFVQFSFYQFVYNIVSACSFVRLLVYFLTEIVRYSIGFVSQRGWDPFPIWPHTFVSPTADSRGAVVSYWRKYVHEVLVNRLGGLNLPRKSVVRLTDRPDMTLDGYRGPKTIKQLHQLYIKSDVRGIP